jgi:hypothetical protein
VHRIGFAPCGPRSTGAERTLYGEIRGMRDTPGAGSVRNPHDGDRPRLGVMKFPGKTSCKSAGLVGEAENMCKSTVLSDRSIDPNHMGLSS